MKDFLNPKSMLTPGAAGALIMFLVNGICFTFPELAPRYVALALSFVIGGLAVSGGTIKPLERGMYWFLNSLIIFCMGMGTANLASSAVAGSAQTPPPKQAQATGSWFISSAQADTSTVSPRPVVKPKIKPKPLVKPKQPSASEVATMKAQLLEQQKMIEALRQQNLQIQQNKAASTTPAPAPTTPAKAPQQQRFFKSW